MLQSLQEGGADGETAGFVQTKSASPTAGTAASHGGESQGAWGALSTFCPQRGRFNYARAD
jgi:hypothetical protein